MIEKLKFVPGSFSRLSNDELEALAKQVITELGYFDPEMLGLTFVYNELVKAHAQQHATTVPRGRHPLSLIVISNRVDRLKLIRSLISQVKSLKRVNTVYEIPLMNEIAIFVEEYLVPISKRNSTVQTNRLNKMYIALEVREDIQGAIANLSLKASFDKLAELNESYESKEAERVLSRKRRLLQSALVTKKVHEALVYLMKEVELAQLKNPEIDYNDLISKMNETFTKALALVKSRSTARKNSKRRKEENVESIENTTAATMTANQEEVTDIL